MAEAAKTTVDRDVAGSTTSSVESGGSGSVPEQAKEKVQEGVEVVQEKAQELKGTAGERVRREVDTRSTEAGTQLQGTASAMRRTTEQLRQEGNEVPAKAMDFVAERTERLGSYLTGANADQVLRDVESIRTAPALARGGRRSSGRVLRGPIPEGVERRPLPDQLGRIRPPDLGSPRVSGRATLRRLGRGASLDGVAARRGAGADGAAGKHEWLVERRRRKSCRFPG